MAPVKFRLILLQILSEAQLKSHIPFILNQLNLREIESPL